MTDRLSEILRQAAGLACALRARRLVLFGSRARGDNRPRSDVDLAVFGMPPENHGKFGPAHRRPDSGGLSGRFFPAG